MNLNQNHSLISNIAYLVYTSIELGKTTKDNKVINLEEGWRVNSTVI